MLKTQKFKNIEFLRYLFTFVIIYFHSVKVRSLYINYDTYENLRILATNADLSVDFFFIMAGFFLFYTFTPDKFAVITFMQKRITRLLPNIIFATLCTYILSLVGFVIYTKYYNFFSIGLINCIGLTLNRGNNGQIWFVSVLFWVSLFYTYLFKCFSKERINLTIALLILFSYSFLLHAYKGSIEGFQKNFYFFINTGVLRGLAGIGLGYFVSLIYKNYTPKVISFKQKIIYTIAEVYLFIFIFNNLLFHNLSYKNDLIIILAFLGLFNLFLLKRGYFSQLLERNIFVSLGKYSYAMFIMQFVVINIFNNLLFKKGAPYYDSNFIASHPYFILISILLACFILGVITYHLVEKPCAKYLSNKFFGNAKNLAPVERENNSLS